MDLTVKVRELKQLLRRDLRKNEHLTDAIRYKDDTKGVTIDTNNYNDAELRALVQIVDDRIIDEPEDRHNKWLRSRLRTFFEMNDEQITDGTIVKNLERLAPALKKFIETHAPHRWIFTDADDHNAVPYFVNDIKFFKRKKTRYGVEPAHTRLWGTAYAHGGTTSTTWTWGESFKAMTVPQALKAQGLIVETPAIVKAHAAEVEKYTKLQSACGLQQSAIGEAMTVGRSSWSWRGTVPMIREGVATRVVLDPLTEEIEGNKDADASSIYNATFWDEVPQVNGSIIRNVGDAEDEDDDDAAEDESKTIEVNLPLHPYLYAFDLDKHRWVDIHVANLQPYEWDKTLLNKLRLPKKHKDLLTVLMSTTGKNIGDIVRGKMQGTIVIATGPPGTGKTLTAEVFSEHIERPLYIVQCSQLGLNIEKIEENLQEVLGRASRWGAVLLIDEADVYIRRRGEDIEQNAIVGVFLRLLEYYRGILFMASNRDEIIDDAILSRATAWIRYELPNEDMLVEIWDVLGAQFKVNLASDDIYELIKKIPGISGRSVRNILKLATMLKGSQTKMTDLITMSEYQALENQSSSVVTEPQPRQR